MGAWEQLLWLSNYFVRCSPRFVLCMFDPSRNTEHNVVLIFNAVQTCVLRRRHLVVDSTHVCIILFASDNIHISKATEAWSGCLDLANMLNASNNVQQISNRDHLFYSLLSFIQGSTLLGPFQHCSTLCESVLPTYKNANLSNHQLLGVCKPVAILFELVQTMQK